MKLLLDMLPFKKYLYEIAIFLLIFFKKNPLAGRTFFVKTDTQGQLEPKFNG